MTAPASTGVVRMEVTIFPDTVPLRKRARQAYSYQFNMFTLSSTTSNQIKNLETISIENNSTGVTLKKYEAIYHTVCGLPFGYVEATDSASSSANAFSSGIVPAKPNDYRPTVVEDYYIDDLGTRIYSYEFLRAMRDHQTFVLDGSLFSSNFRTQEDVDKLLKNSPTEITIPSLNLSGSNTINIKDVREKALKAILPNGGTYELAETMSEYDYIRSRSFDISNFSRAKWHDSGFFTNNSNSYLQSADSLETNVWKSFDGSSVDTSDVYKNSSTNLFNDEEEQRQRKSKITTYAGYVGIKNVLPTSFVELMRQAYISFVTIPRAHSFKDEASYNDLENGVIGIDVDGNFSAVPPGVHCTFRKVTPIFHGEDFTIRFQKLSVQHPIATVSDETVDGLKYFLRESYRSIDSAKNQSTSTSGVSQNNAVAPFFYKNIEGTEVLDNTKYLDIQKARNYYLGNQPYVVVEINGGTDNRFFLMIPENGEVLMIEETSDAIIYDDIDSFSSNVVPHIWKDGKQRSRVIYGFGFSGKSLLSLDSFSVDFQHYRGSLQVKFSNNEKIHVITRKVYGRNIPQTLIKQALDSFYAKDRVQGELVPIKLYGSVKVHMGHVKMAFNFSPISYPPSATLNINNPVGIMNLDGKKEFVNILLRTAGGYEESENKPFNDNEYLVKNESGDPVVGQESPFFNQQAHNFIESLNGEKKKFNIKDLPLAYRQSVTGPIPVDMKSEDFKFFKLLRGSSISAGFNLTDAKEFVNRIYPYITIKSGDVQFKAIKSGHTWELKGAIRPVCDGFSVFVPEGTEPAWKPVSADVTVNVTSFSDNWTRSDRTFMAHSGSISFHLNKADAIPILESLSAVQTEKGELFSGVRKAKSFDTNGAINYGYSVGDMTSFLASLQDKYFYVQVRAWRDPVKTRTHGVGLADNYSTYSENSTSFYGTHHNRYPNAENTIIFTGFCKQSNFIVRESHIEMNCNLVDYWEMLDQMKWLNPPFYDAMRDYNAVMDVIQRAGLFYEKGRNSPGYLIHKYLSTPSNGDYYEIPYDGYSVLANDYVLPGSYNTMNQPMLKPVSGQDSYGSFLKKIANMSGKIMYFDRKGVLHFDIPEDELELFQVEGASPGRVIYQARPFDIFSFTHSVANGEQVPWWNVLIGEYKFDRAVEDIVNEIRVVSSTPDGTLVSAAHMNRASMSDIDLPGFIGFRKMFIHKSGYFGSGAAVRKIVERYTTMFNAPVRASFQVLGRVGLQANQTILVDGPGTSAPYRLLITNVSNTITPSENKWVANLQGRYFLPGEKIKFSGTTLTVGAGGG